MFSVALAGIVSNESTRADDRVRTGDLNLGKVPRYQLRYVRILRDGVVARSRSAKSSLWRVQPPKQRLCEIR